AYTLILATTVSISLIAETCGFPNTSHFIAQFRRRYSITPMRLREAASTATGSGDDITIEL
ncbi:MAG: helix-turn-helix transcriptional regulator, partial [Alistipes sp.]|nr:helix-turn-helix transcriptional regulator [Alistipes sp.]